MPHAKNVPTKERILEAALELFAQRGYQGTGLRDIAAAVGIRESSLYKHFPSKQHIYDGLFARMEQISQRAEQQMGLPPKEKAAAAQFYKNITEKQLVALSLSLFRFYLHHPFAARFHCILLQQPFEDRQAKARYADYYLLEPLRFQSGVFRSMMQEGALPAADPRQLAEDFFLPLYYWQMLASCRPEQEAEIEKKVVAHVRRFRRTRMVGADASAKDVPVKGRRAAHKESSACAMKKADAAQKAPSQAAVKKEKRAL